MTLSVPVATAVNTMNAAAQCAESTVTLRDTNERNIKSSSFLIGPIITK